MQVRSIGGHCTGRGGFFAGSVGMLVVTFAVSGCSPSSQDAASESESVRVPIVVYADNYPMAYFAERIGGDLVDVTLPVPPNRDPGYWKPEGDVVEEIQNADMIVLNGADYSKWSKVLSLPTSKIVDASRPFRDRFIYVEDAVTHSHGSEGEHTHAGLQSYTWLDPDQAVLQAEAIKNSLIKRLPEKQEEFTKGYDELVDDLHALRDRLQELVAKRDEPLLASHPVYDYLARHCGWDLLSMHWEPDEVPEQEEWDKLAKLLTNHHARWMIWEGTPVETNVQKLTGLGIDSVVFDPCMNTPESGDYLSVMNDNVKNLERIYLYEPDGDSGRSE